MRAVAYTRSGGAEVLTLIERPRPEPGPGEVRHAAIQLARWAGAAVIATVSSPAKAALAGAAGAQHTVDYRQPEPARAIRELAPGGIDLVVEVDPGHNAELNAAVVGPGACI